MLLMRTLRPFSHKVFKIVDKIAVENIIIGSDFNLVLDCEKDRFKSNTNNWKSANYVQKIMDEFEYYDVWRTINPDDSKYT